MENIKVVKTNLEAQWKEVFTTEWSGLRGKFKKLSKRFVDEKLTEISEKTFCKYIFAKNSQPSPEKLKVWNWLLIAHWTEIRSVWALIFYFQLGVKSLLIKYLHFLNDIASVILDFIFKVRRKIAVAGFLAEHKKSNRHDFKELLWIFFNISKKLKISRP